MAWGRRRVKGSTEEAQSNEKVGAQERSGMAQNRHESPGEAHGVAQGRRRAKGSAGEAHNTQERRSGHNRPKKAVSG